MKLYSIKMRASLKGKHISGAERIVPEEQVLSTPPTLLKRLKGKRFDNISIKVEALETEPITIPKALKIKEHIFNSPEEGNKRAVEIIHRATGIPHHKIYQIIQTVHRGASPDGSNMRGAMIVNQQGERIEADRYKGVRTTLIDFVDRQSIEEKLIKQGYTNRTADALALATKNLHYPDILAEYCISDEPDYTIGYVAVKGVYHRLNPLKKEGNPKGGRIYFVKDGADINKLVKFLTETPVLVEGL
ncbi:MAG: 6-carboxyhexanoate--CoA ligase [Aquificae bacterium]|nr:6-carboxyhexanoate--CoA ligase [Aquificota bacterium]